MIAIRSNIKEVIAQTERLLTTIPEAMERAWAPALWADEARDLAEQTMRALATAEEEKYIGDFVASVTTSILPAGGLKITMNNRRNQTGSLVEAQAARAAMVPGIRGLFEEQVQNFEDLLLEWVETEKRKDKRDYGKTDEEVRDLISYILLSPNPGDKAKAAREKLTPHIENFLAKRAGAGLSPERASEFLRAVLAAWRELVKSKYAEKVRTQLHQLMGATT